MRFFFHWYTIKQKANTHTRTQINKNNKKKRLKTRNLYKLKLRKKIFYLGSHCQNVHKIALSEP
uniref:Uncharacterized protein n=1 Tax=Rhizophora mucronata TaxID=61149 RepID=A0A2P2J9S3_RHIMU